MHTPNNGSNGLRTGLHPLPIPNPVAHDQQPSNFSFREGDERLHRNPSATIGPKPTLPPHRPLGYENIRLGSEEDDDDETAICVKKLLQDSTRISTLATYAHELGQEYSQLSHREVIDCILGRMQEILDESVHSSQGDLQNEAGLIRRLLIRSCRDLNVLPPSFFLIGTQCWDRSNPSFGGGFSDIFPATLKGERVALKRLRLFLCNRVRTATPLGSQRAKLRPRPRIPTPPTNGRGIIPGSPWRQLDMPPEFYREAIIWRQLAHPNIQPFLGIDKATFPHCVCMVSPWAALGNVHDASDYLKSQSYEAPINDWILGIAKGLAYLHKEKVVHGDLRGNNVLIDSDLQPRLTDFGLSRFTDAHTRTMGSYDGGNERWMSPELLDNSLPRSNVKSDVYAFACTCIELYTGATPFPGVRGVTVTTKVLAGERPKRPGLEGGRPMPNELWDLVQCCWDVEPDRRPTMAEVVQLLGSIRSA